MKKIVFQMRRGLSSAWSAKNPVLQAGEPGIEIDTQKSKVGDGMTPWNTLEYQKSDSDPDDDDGPSLVLLYQNAKV